MTNAFVQSQLDAYAAAAPTRPGRRLRWLDELREQNRAAFAAGGLPGARDEQWKYTQLKALEKRALASDQHATTRPVDATRLELPGTGAPRLVFVNGAFRADLSRVESAEGLTLLSLADALERGDTGLEFFLSRRFRAPAEGFAQLNTALAHDGAVVRVAPGARVAAPLHLVHVGAPGDRAIAWHARNLVELGEGAALSIVEHHVGAAAHDGVGNVVTQLGLAAG
ncbi:MAG TPA: Fe-S cluster assembly protein SufD, partial [Xanthomonadales bacterium]|nr:Fe-S cluster assembly protein SufD [Xanthomonadales bacterium]